MNKEVVLQSRVEPELMIQFKRLLKKKDKNEQCPK